MFAYDLEHAPERSLYEALTACVRRDIQNGVFQAGSRLPSKRRAAADLGVSVATVQNAYAQLAAEGYLVARERRGYFVADIVQQPPREAPPREARRQAEAEVPPDGDVLDLTQGALSPDLFPLSVWARLSNRVYRGEGERLLRRMPYNGLLPLREAIADILYRSRGISAPPERILISAGNEQLYAVFLSYFGRDAVFGTENPGHSLISRLYRENGAAVRPLPMDDSGVVPAALAASDARILHISPSHHFPSGIVTPVARRQALLAWAAERPGRFIIEDDYDSEFRMAGRPIPSLQHMDRSGRVIYINTFSKTVAPALRIAYAVLPPEVSDGYRARFGFLSCPVPAAEQLILSAFIREGYFERHVNRLRTRLRARRDALLARLAASPRAPRYEVRRPDGGLHFLLRVDTPLSDARLVQEAEENGIRMLCVSNYAVGPLADTRTFVVSYAGLPEARAEEFVRRLDRIG